MRHCNYACQSREHLIARRTFLGAATGAVVGGLGVFAGRSQAAQLASEQKRVVVFNMHGGLSQLESWDPKPGTDTGGPFLSIPTSVPGVHFSELLPETAKIAHHLCVARGVNTKEDDHGKGAYYVLTGHRQQPAQSYPQLGAVVAKAIAPEENPLPGHVVITPGGGGSRGSDSAYLGPKYASISLGNGNPPSYLKRPAAVSDVSEQARHDFRRKVNERFLSRRRTAITDAYTNSYEQALKLMQKADTFDVTQEPAADLERYGKHDLGRHTLLARRLLEKGVTFVQVTHSNYDTHNENFNFHLEQVGEFDRPFAALVTDLAARGMLDSTLIVVLSEFGRTPNVNLYYGRDHWSAAWSIAMAGAKLPRGAAYGKTNDRGTEVVDGQCDAAELFHTYLAAVGVDSNGSFDLEGREFPIADPAVKPIKALVG
ncbi:hypothetical protein Pan44_29540 [Caulifigura coniformis]|uniref:DUF1501 domain-containing protein n=1 Tax=Caulifigura coniformis TaxID=2527983 RepID=A0A517SFK3_9PLAN|nr:DUF1501 domain-containing protein [Caulifigura coniformis]QDT54914.1 hypothetical protein Pan44_29540 [Caulifigura coniformis]